MQNAVESALEKNLQQDITLVPVIEQSRDISIKWKLYFVQNKLDGIKKPLALILSEIMLFMTVDKMVLLAIWDVFLAKFTEIIFIILV